MFGGGPVICSPLIDFLRSFFLPDVSRAGLLQRAIRKEAYTSDMSALTVLWRSLDLFVVPNWFLCTDAVNGGISSVLESI